MPVAWTTDELLVAGTAILEGRLYSAIRGGLQKLPLSAAPICSDLLGLQSAGRTRGHNSG